MKLFKGFRIMRSGNVYACVAGDYVGQMLMYFDKTKTDYGFLIIPTMENMWIPKDKFDLGLKENIVEFVERVPSYVRDISKAQFTENREKL